MRIKNTDYREKICFYCSPEQFERSRQVFGNDGVRGKILSKLFDVVLSVGETRGEGYLASLAYSEEDSITVTRRMCEISTN